MLVCFALPEEAKAFRRIAQAQPGLSILVTGIGKANSERTVRKFLTTQSPAFVLTCGFAGGLKPELSSGTVIYATEDRTLASKLEAAGGKAAHFVCVSRIATTVLEKQQLHRQSGADAVEMESEAIQGICRERGIPCATVRVISDAAHEDLPLDFNQLANPDLSLNYGKLAWAIFKSPKKIPALMHLQKKCSAAAENLARVLQQVIAAR